MENKWWNYVKPGHKIKCTSSITEGKEPGVGWAANKVFILKQIESDIAWPDDDTHGIFVQACYPVFKVGDWVTRLESWPNPLDGKITHKVRSVDSIGSIEVEWSACPTALSRNTAFRFATEKEIAAAMSLLKKDITSLVYPNVVFVSSKKDWDTLKQFHDKITRYEPLYKFYLIGGGVGDLKSYKFKNSEYTIYSFTDLVIPAGGPGTNRLSSLPEKWCVRSTLEVKRYFDKCTKGDIYEKCYDRTDYYLHRFDNEGIDIAKATGATSYIYAAVKRGYTEISLEDFKELVLKKQVVKPEETLDKHTIQSALDFAIMNYPIGTIVKAKSGTTYEVTSAPVYLENWSTNGIKDVIVSHYGNTNCNVVLYKFKDQEWVERITPKASVKKESKKSTYPALRHSKAKPTVAMPKRRALKIPKRLSVIKIK